MKTWFKKNISLFIVVGVVLSLVFALSAQSTVSVVANPSLISINVERDNHIEFAPTSVVQTSWGYRYVLENGDVVEVGDSTTPDFKANVKTIRNDSSCWFSLGWVAGVYAPTLNDLTVSFDFNANTKVSIYPVPPSARLPEGGIEYDIQLLKKPAQNTITLDIDWQGITWQKILPLNIEYDEARCEDVFGLQGVPYILTATSIVGADGVTYKTRAEYEVNSYLGTATSNRKDTSAMGWNETIQQPITFTKLSQTYLYIHRGQMTDALGNKAWVEDISLNETAKTITFTLPREWLRTASYPVSQVCGVDPAYTQQMASWQSGTFSDADITWSDYDLFTNKSVPKGALAEIIMGNEQQTTENRRGVRTDGSAQSTRYVNIHEPEGGGETHVRMFAICHATTGLIECYHSDVSDADYYYLVGYWQNVTYTEEDNAFSANSGGDWVDETLAVGASAVHTIILLNAEADTANTLGIRVNGSSLERKLLVHEQEAGGFNALDLLVKSDASKIIDVYSSDATNAYFMDTGYFGSELDFVEDWQSNQGVDSWADWDLTAYLDQDGRVADFLLVHTAEAATATMGVRAGSDDATARTLVEHEAESAGAGGEYTGFSMSAQTHTDGHVHIQLPATSSYAYFTGYFKPTVSFNISNSPSSEALGVVADSSTYYAFGSAPSNPVQDGECTFTITNSGSQCDLDMKITDFTGGTSWNIVAGAPDANEVRVTAYYSGQNPGSGLVLANTDAEFYDQLAVSAHIHWDFKFETGTLTDEANQHTATLTITAVAED